MWARFWGKGNKVYYYLPRMRRTVRFTVIFLLSCTLAKISRFKGYSGFLFWVRDRKHMLRLDGILLHSYLLLLASDVSSCMSCLIEIYSFLWPQKDKGTTIVLFGWKSVSLGLSTMRKEKERNQFETLNKWHNKLKSKASW
jgi:hypothetical protein